jgi:hypothetical protein
MTNGFLGAVRSLYGLMRLQKREQERAPLPDIVLFEYTLNDILLVSRKAISLSRRSRRPCEHFRTARRRLVLQTTAGGVNLGLPETVIWRIPA